MRKKINEIAFKDKPFTTAKLLGNGLPYKIIASTLNISEKTVAKHVSNIFGKVKVTNKNELILKLEAKELNQQANRRIDERFQ